MTFDELCLAEPVLRALEREGYTSPTPIQAQAIPPLLENRDILAIAQTGTGKTAAFALPILHRLANEPQATPKRGCRALVLSPTRELAAQIAESFRTYGRFLEVSIAVVVGGVDFRKQVKKLVPGVDVLVATPGRLIDHVEQGTVKLGDTEVFVLDEADQMLDMGFVRPIRRIARELPKKRQNLFFSATMPKEIAGLAGELLTNPVEIAVAPVATTAERVEQRVIHVEAGRKRALLTELFADPAMQRSLVFTRTKRGADRVASHLESAGVTAVAIHGNKSQSQRTKALAAFRAASVRVLVATDIAARGIDIDDVTHVVNYELPEVPEAYVHRIGRTARAGASGQAISLCDAQERDLLRGIEKLTRQRIPSHSRVGDEALEVTAVPVRRNGQSEARGGSSQGPRGPRGNGARGDGARGDGNRARSGKGPRPQRDADADERPVPRSPVTGQPYKARDENRTGDPAASPKRSRRPEGSSSPNRAQRAEGGRRNGADSESYDNRRRGGRGEENGQESPLRERGYRADDGQKSRGREDRRPDGRRAEAGRCEPRRPDARRAEGQRPGKGPVRFGEEAAERPQARDRSGTTAPGATERTSRPPRRNEGRPHAARGARAEAGGHRTGGARPRRRAETAAH